MAKKKEVVDITKDAKKTGKAYGKNHAGKNRGRPDRHAPALQRICHPPGLRRPADGLDRRHRRRGGPAVYRQGRNHRVRGPSALHRPRLPERYHRAGSGGDLGGAYQPGGPGGQLCGKAGRIPPADQPGLRGFCGPGRA